MPTPNRAGGVGRSQYGPGLKVLYQGPFFKQDPAKTFRQNRHDFIVDVMDYAYEVAVRAAPESSGDYIHALRRNDEPALRFANLRGRKWAVTGILSMRKLAHPWHNPDHHSRHWYTKGRRGVGVRSGGYFNYAGKVERKYHVFRKARSAVYSARKHNADLLRNLT